jgi:hypothetical protein
MEDEGSVWNTNFIRTGNVQFETWSLAKRSAAACEDD